LSLGIKPTKNLGYANAIELVPLTTTRWNQALSQITDVFFC